MKIARAAERFRGLINSNLRAQPGVLSHSEALLDALWEHAAQRQFAFCHEWRAGDLLMWNNLAVLHRRDPFDANTRRVMHRTQIKGHERVA